MAGSTYGTYEPSSSAVSALKLSLLYFLPPEQQQQQQQTIHKTTQTTNKKQATDDISFREATIRTLSIIKDTSVSY